MKTGFSENKITLCGIYDFDLKKTFECGQCFRFNEAGGGYEGVAHGKLLRLRQTGDKIEISGIGRRDFELFFKSFFDLERDYEKIDRELSDDPVLLPIIPQSRGIRILRQEPFEALVSFIISASNNIPRIKKIVELLCESFGERNVSANGREYFAFPTPDRLAALEPEDLSVIRAGFRDRYIIDCARKVASGRVSLEKVAKMSCEDGARELMKIDGVGRKVADCALLYGFGNFSCFPKDVWIKRVLKSLYGREDNAGLDFHGYDGVAQQYLYYYARLNSIR